jgi:23S rRNA pseudouridine2605 synthase
MSAFHGLARVLSKRGFCSRSRAFELVREGRVKVRGKTITDPEWRTRVDEPAIAIDGDPLADAPASFTAIVLNKPRGLLTTAADELGRETVFACLAGAKLPRLVPVGRLDKASEGLLVFTNDTRWADHLTAPGSGVVKTYHVQVKPPPSPEQMASMLAGVDTGATGSMRVRGAVILRSGGKTAWLEIILDEGRNRQIRRIAEALGLEVLRLIRVAIGGVQLGDLAKGKWRYLTPDEVSRLGAAPAHPSDLGPHGRNANKIGG